MSTNQEGPAHDRRQQLVAAGLTTLREQGYAGFTRPRVAARAGLRQSHITYDHPTRLDLLAAVGRVAVDRPLAAVDATLAALHTPEEAARAIAASVTRHENTRVLMALVQAGDEEPRLRELVRELADGIAARGASFLARIGGVPAAEEPARFLHALSVGLAVIDLATGRPDGKQRAAGILATALHLLAGGHRPA
ncbi:TetR/AcrR family transcriptional regulator [Methylobacterium sp. NEAU 140]|uniref:TetR/AcrR family transcriptional regulator n=1 Tax=Methylobacterium sp. NEAU 140 TaxID=3064945 RepID=UPI00273754D4|nr:TetR/AcrR family transcriptional regulator [Methylobacterium sp. NEAU 140]MDP4023997.1 TetR/AcrR family transcriptional regulator [Methylobacterium sp. NEAU 140]